MSIWQTIRYCCCCCEKSKKDDAIEEDEDTCVDIIIDTCLDIEMGDYDEKEEKEEREPFLHEPTIPSRVRRRPQIQDWDIL